MCAGGLPTTNNTHPVDVIKAGLEMQAFIERNKEERIKINQPYFELRLGIHTGPVVAGIVGVTRLIEHEHWASDLISGAVIGYLCGKQVVGNENRLFPNYKVAEKRSRSYIIPFNSAGITGIEWRMIF